MSGHVFCRMFVFCLKDSRNWSNNITLAGGGFGADSEIIRHSVGNTPSLQIVSRMFSINSGLLSNESSMKTHKSGVQFGIDKMSTICGRWGMTDSRFNFKIEVSSGS